MSWFLLKLLFDSCVKTFCPKVRQWELEKWHEVPYLSYVLYLIGKVILKLPY